ncbi:MAG: DUF3791 domain-containing protein [Chitinispirillales bacterium]|nr:DUF3791 domain-containing protein [Chitinispirillales bacterium]
MNIIRPEGRVWFLASCVELYKDVKGMSRHEAYGYLRETGAVRFIVDCWEALHTTSPAFIVDSIDEYVRNNA